MSAKISIITVCFNARSALAETKASVFDQDFDDFEWIVVDGASGDGTVEDLEALDDPRVNSFSEPDGGIYDAMNKGTQLANGKYILYLNAGDELHREFSYDTLEKAMNNLGACMLWCRADVQDRTGTIYPRKTRSPAWLRYGTAVCHQAVFFNRLVLGSNPYDTKLNVAGDYDLICRLFKSGKGIELLDTPVCVFDLVGKSGTDKRLTLREESQVRQKHFAIPGFVSRAILEFKYLVWQTGTFLPSFRRAWSRFF
jgi:putative colanic acid biosynthesis glycosyltransferase